MIRIGIVGCAQSLADHLRGYRLLREAGMDDFRITALCSQNLDDVRMFATRGQGPEQTVPASHPRGDPMGADTEYVSDFQDDVDVGLFDDFAQMIADDRVDAINDFSSHGIHHLVAASTCEHQKDLLTRSPMTVTLKMARTMNAWFAERGLVFGVFEGLRFRPQTRHLKWLIESDLLGTLQMILVGDIGSEWAPNQVVARSPSWHAQNAAGGIAFERGLHQFHLVRYLAGDIDLISGTTTIVEPTRILDYPDLGYAASYDCDAADTYFAQFRTKGQVSGNLFASWAGRGQPTLIPGGAVFYGTRGRVSGTTITWDGGQQNSLSEVYEGTTTADRRDNEFPSGIQDEYALAQLDWLTAVRERRSPEVGGCEGILDLACAIAILESSRLGRSVQVDEIVSGELAGCQWGIEQYYGLLDD